MSTNGETADLMVREGIQITESALKLAGLGAKNLAALLIALANDNQKLAGKTNLKRLIQAVAGKAHRVSVIMPSLYGGRQHRRVVRESLDCAVALQELQTMGVRNIITFDAHDPRVQNAVPLLSFDNAMPTYQVLKSLLKKNPEISFDKEQFIVVSPDEGAMNRNMYFSSVLGCNLGMFYKRRDYTRVVNGRNPIVAHEYLGESVEGKTVFIADDIIASGESMLEVAGNLKKRGAGRIIANATFPLFTSGLAKFDQAVADGTLDYENPDTLDLPLIKQCLRELSETGKTVLPVYDFSKEARSSETEEIDLKGGVCIVEGIHALNPELTSLVPGDQIYRVYAGLREEYCIDGRRTINTQDIRLCRRTLRDAATRGRSPAKTLTMWDHVLDGETRYIKGFKTTADFLLDTSFTYELGLISNLLGVVRRQFTLEGHNAELWDETARRFEHVAPLPLDLLPADSMLREFYGSEAN